MTVLFFSSLSFREYAHYFFGTFRARLHPVLWRGNEGVVYADEHPLHSGQLCSAKRLVFVVKVRINDVALVIFHNSCSDLDSD
jgi:hypothetical protein